MPVAFFVVVAMFISLASRLWMTAGELVALAISLRLRDPAQ